MQKTANHDTEQSSDVGEPKAKKSGRLLPVATACRNCGTRTVGPYCHMCGQELTAGRGRRLRELVSDSLGTIWAMDGRAARTLWTLVSRPGKLTAEFYAGRIVRYVFPTKLFWFMTLVTFALLFSLPKPDGASDPSIEFTPSAVTADAGGEGGGDTKNGSLLEQKELWDMTVSWGPYMMFALVPIFALLVMLFFWRRERPYSDYLVFTLHYNSAAYLIMALMTVVGRVLFPGSKGAFLFMLLLTFLYLILAARRVYGGRMVPMVAKLVALSLVYMIISLITLVFFLIVYIVFIKKIDIFA